MSGVGLYYRRDGSTHDNPMEWARSLYEEERRVALTTLGEVKVSTVFLGIDHGFGLTKHPILYETLVFDGPLDANCERWTNEVAALAGHDQWVERVREALAQPVEERRARDAGQALDRPE